MKITIDRSRTPLPEGIAGRSMNLSLAKARLTFRGGPETVERFYDSSSRKCGHAPNTQATSFSMPPSSYPEHNYSITITTIYLH